MYIILSAVPIATMILGDRIKCFMMWATYVVFELLRWVRIFVGQIIWFGYRKSLGKYIWCFGWK